jgi:hypothetical protein
LVLQSCAQGEGGEIFVLDMGKPVRIVELARQIVRLSGLQPDRDIEIKFIGLRPGEKLFEELRHLRANCVDTAHPRLKRLTSEPASLETVQGQLSSLKSAMHTATPDELKAMLKEILPEYTPCFESAEAEEREDGKSKVKERSWKTEEGRQKTGGDGAEDGTSAGGEAKGPTKRLVVTVAVVAAEPVAPRHRPIAAPANRRIPASTHRPGGNGL